MESKSKALLENLIKFYNVQENFDKLQNILQNKTQISMRIIEYYTTVYAKENNRLLHNEYKNMLRGLNKANFDPYCRKVKGVKTIFLFECESGNCYTTVAQANFYKWIIEKGIVECIQKEYPDISELCSRLRGAPKTNLTS